MKAVLDTNVLASAAMTTHGVCAQILDLLVAGVFGICADDRLLDEYDTVLHRPGLRIVPEEAAIVLELVRSAAEIVSAFPLPAKLPDPSDLPFLEVADAADAILVTGNKRHFPPSACGRVTVLSPAAFLDLLRRSA